MVNSYTMDRFRILPNTASTFCVRMSISLSISAKVSNKNPYAMDIFKFFPNTALRFVDASRDKPERRPLSVLSLRLSRRRAFAR